MSSKHVVVVLGSGRSGTSLLMQVLHDMGMVVSEQMTEASVANPLGPFEDLEIFKLQTALIKDLGALTTAPMPNGWLKEKSCIRAMADLEAVIQNRIAEVEGLFGFKDPKTSMLVPLWVRVFNKLKVTPIYLVAVRDPRATVSSFLMQYNQPAHLTELVWLVRMVESLDNTGADCFIAHYEDWFLGGESMAQALLAYTGLERSFKGSLPRVLSNILKLNLNRASKDYHEIQNPYVLKLYTALKECHGAKFDRERLMAVVKQCRQAMEGFKGWYELAHQANKKLADAQMRLEKLSIEAAKVKALEIEKVQNAQLADQVQKLQRQVNQLMALGGVN